jgi:adenine/guanine/hypoxanthine permease
VGESLRAVNLLGNGFIISALVWGAATAELIDRRYVRSAGFLLCGAVLSLFGVIHSPAMRGTFVLPWSEPSRLPLQFALAYGAAALTVLAAKLLPGTAAAEKSAAPSPDA